MNAEVKPERSEVHCLSASLSEHDLEPVSGLSALPIFKIQYGVRDALFEADVMQSSSSHLAFF